MNKLLPTSPTDQKRKRRFGVWGPPALFGVIIALALATACSGSHNSNFAPVSAIPTAPSSSLKGEAANSAARPLGLGSWPPSQALQAQ